MATRTCRSCRARTFQTIRLLPDATVLENIIIGMFRHQKASLAAQLFALPSSRRETERFRTAAIALLDQFRMRRYADYPAGGLSYGDQRRVEMMRALAARPSMILLDEPVAGMNDVEAEALGEIFRDLAKKGMGVLLIEHNLGFVTSMCDHIYVLNGGRLIAEGNAEKVINDPAVVAAYIGEDDDA
jgi:branched-chain amino acid transport system ATP-binding protein